MFILTVQKSKYYFPTNFTTKLSSIPVHSFQYFSKRVQGIIKINSCTKNGSHFSLKKRNCVVVTISNFLIPTYLWCKPLIFQI